MLKIKYLVVLLAVLAVANQTLVAQTRTYAVTGGELLFQWADIKFSDAYMQAHPNDVQVDNPLRFTCFFHVGQYLHMDFSDNLGIYTGLAVRNVGLISDEKLEVPNGTGVGTMMPDYKIIRRQYTLGLPLALKLGSFNNHFFVFGGGEIEYAFVYKEKYWKSHDRDGEKTKNVEWFASQTPDFMPSVFVGVQMPGGINVKVKYYLDNFLNNSYKSSSTVSDLTRYETSKVAYVSLSYNIPTSQMFKSDGAKGKTAMK